jgi:hypothetical protein
MTRFPGQAIILAISLGALALPALGAPPPGGARVRVLPAIEVRAEAADSLLARDVQAMVEAALTDYLPEELTGDRQPIVVILAKDREQFRLLARGQSPEWAAGIILKRGEIILIEKTYLLDRVQARHLLRHELAHVLLDRQLQGNEVPHWFHEGFAQIHAGEWDMERLWLLARAAWTRSAIPLGDLRRGFPYGGERAQLAYAQSQAALQELHKDPESWSHLLELLRDQVPFGAALRRSFGLEMHAFEAEFDAKVMPGFRRWSLLFSTAPLFFLMMLIFLIAGWRRMRRQRRVEDKEEVPQEEWFAKGWIDRQWPG